MLRIIGVIVLIILVFALLGVGVSAAYHRYQLSREGQAYPPWGEMVEVDGQQLHVYTEGQGDHTLVFLAGHGTSNPTIDFKPLWMHLTDQYQIAVVERNGYGWSEATNSPRDLNTMLQETRQALKAAGVTGPYILLPHSMSGLEAIHWAQEYPDEVGAIIGLDPTTPKVIKALPEPSKIELYTTYLISRIGLSRFMPREDLEKNFPILATEALTEKEKQEYAAVFYRSFLTGPMLREIDFLEENAGIVDQREAPKNTPMLFFISKDQDNEIKGWKDLQTDYLSEIESSEYVELKTGHYLHHEKGEVMAEKIKGYIASLPWDR